MLTDLPVLGLADIVGTAGESAFVAPATAAPAPAPAPADAAVAPAPATGESPPSSWLNGSISVGVSGPEEPFTRTADASGLGLFSFTLSS